MMKKKLIIISVAFIAMAFSCDFNYYDTVNKALGLDASGLTIQAEIPYAAITVDGDYTDWDAVPVAMTLPDNLQALSFESVKFAQSSTSLYVLITLHSNSNNNYDSLGLGFVINASQTDSAYGNLIVVPEKRVTRIKSSWSGSTFSGWYWDHTISDYWEFGQNYGIWGIDGTQNTIELELDKKIAYHHEWAPDREKLFAFFLMNVLGHSISPDPNLNASAEDWVSGIVTFDDIMVENYYLYDQDEDPKSFNFKHYLIHKL